MTQKLANMMSFIDGPLATLQKIVFLFSDGTRVEPEPEKPGFMYENLNPGSENQNPGFSGFEVLQFQNDFHI